MTGDMPRSNVLLRFYIIITRLGRLEDVGQAAAALDKAVGHVAVRGHDRPRAKLVWLSSLVIMVSVVNSVLNGVVLHVVVVILLLCSTYVHVERLRHDLECADPLTHVEVVGWPPMG